MKAGDSVPGQWPFGLSDEDETQAMRIHREAIIVDMVNQHPGGVDIYKEYPPELLQERLGNLQPGLNGVGQALFLPYILALEGGPDIIRQWWDESGVTIGTRGFLMASPDLMGRMRTYHELAERIHDLPWLRRVTTAAEMRQVKADGLHALYSYCQPVYGLSTDLMDINRAYDEGLRMLMLTYNRMDYVGAGCTERSDAGLSMYGVEVVKRCNTLGIIVDTSHCGRQTTLDACALSVAPVFANHTAAQGVYNHARGKSDEELKAIAASGGIIGVVAVPFFLSADPDATIEIMLDHIDYIVGLVGWQHVGIGTDWPMQGTEAAMVQALGGIIGDIGFRSEDKIITTKTLHGFKDYRDMPNITRGLWARGYSESQIKGILGENFLRVFGQVCG